MYNQSSQQDIDLRNNQAWMEAMAREAAKRAESSIAIRKEYEKYAKYKTDPVGFGMEVLGEWYTDDIKKVMESVRDNPVTVAKSCNGAGKSHGAARIAVWFYKTMPLSKVYLTAAPPEENLKKILWGEVSSIVQDHPALFERDSVRASGISISPKNFITCVTIPQSGSSTERIAKFSGKHAPNMLFIVDEGDAVPEEIYQGIESCMSGGNVRLLIMFNPKHQTGPVYMKEKDRTANVVNLSAFSHPNVITGDNLIPGAVDREITARRINEWTQPMRSDMSPDANCFVVPDFLVDYQARTLSGTVYEPLKPGWRKIKEAQFSYMVLGQYPSQAESQLIASDWIDAARTRWDLFVASNGERPPIGISPILALDAAEQGEDYNVVALRYSGYVPRFTMWSGVDMDVTTRKTLQLYKDVKADIAMIDATGIGAGVAPAMARMGRDSDVRAISVKVSSKPTGTVKTELGDFFQLRDQLWWSLREWLRTDNTSMLPPDQYLIDELKAVSYKIREADGRVQITGKDRLRSLLRRSPDRADALCLTFAPFSRPKIIRLD